VEDVTQSSATEEAYGAGGELLARYTGDTNSRSFVPLNGRLLAEYYCGGVIFDHPDELGSATTATDCTGKNVQERLCYPFGEFWNGAGSLGMHQMFAQLPDYDPETDQYNTANRHYTPMGRWLSPDPSGVKAARLDDPQTWNMYAYARNTPVRYTDPTGLYVTTCADDDKKCQAQATNFENARQADLNSDDASVRAAAAAYGDPGDNSGVTVSFVSNKQLGQGEAGDTAAGVTTDRNGNIVPDIQVKILRGQGAEELQETVGHEGSHVEDDLAFIGSITPSGSYNSAVNLTKYETEYKAYRVEAAIARSLGATVSLGSTGRYVLSPRDLPAQTSATINGFLRDPANHYSVSPQNPGPRLFPLP
jgi:RHS repeat-associated protein